MRKFLITILSVICAAFMIGALVACGDEKDDGLTEYTVFVYSPGGSKLRGVTVSVYDDELNRVGQEMTDSTGSVSFRLEEGDYSVKLTTLPNGYFHRTANNYTFEEDIKELKIYLESKVITGSAPANYQYTAGDVMYDFEVKTTKNTTFKLSEALETKKLVLINFWATWCGPCAEEFPFMAEAYDDYKDDVAIIALSSYDDNAAVANYAANNYPQAKFDWASDSADVSSHFTYSGIPTSIFVDRYGVFCYMHTGAMTTKSEFTRQFNYYCSDNYVPPEFNGDDPEKPYERPIPDVDPVPSSQIEAAINGEGFTGTYRPETETSDAEYSWPWLVGTDKNGDKYIYNSNQGKQQYSFATIYLDYSAKAGDVLAFEYSADIESGNDYFYIFYDNNEEVVSLTGKTDGWQNFYLYVAKEEGDYQVCFFYNTDEMNEENSLVQDIVKIRNIRLTSVDEIAEKGQSRDIKYHCSTDYNETANKWNNYVKVGLNETDGYYHLLDGQNKPNGPLVLLNVMYESHWNNNPLYELAYLGLLDFGAKGNYNDMIIKYAGYSSYSDYRNYVPVTEELQKALEQITYNYIPKGQSAHTRYAEEWLEMCVYYEHYGVGEAVKDPIKGVTPFSYYELNEYGDKNTLPYTNENYMTGVQNGDLTRVDVTKVLLPRGLYYKFVPKENGVYEFKTYGDLMDNGTICWIYEADAMLADRTTAKVLNEEIEDNAHFTVYVPMEKGKAYFVMLDLSYQDGTQHGTFYIGIRNAGDEVQKLLRVTSGAYTTSDPDSLTGGALVAAKIIMIADEFIIDPFDGEPYIHDRNVTTNLYLDLFGDNPLTAYPLAEIIKPTPRRTQLKDEDGNLLYEWLMDEDGNFVVDENNNKVYDTSKPIFEKDEQGNDVYRTYYYKTFIYDKNGHNIPETDSSGNQLYDKNGDPVYKSKELKFEGETLEYLEGLLEEARKVTSDHPYGMVKVDSRLMEFLIEFTHSISDMREGVAGENEAPKYVTNEWLMFCCFYRTYKI